MAAGKRLVRRLFDRSGEPHVECPAPPAAAPTSHTSSHEPEPDAVELHAALHEARSIALADVPKGAQVVLGAGVNGLWYFEWFEQEFGPVERHIGVEAYMPRPEGLPASVEWVDADLASPAGVAAIDTESVDLVFSGQNLEHLWPEQMVAFFCESNRVLRPGGLLVADSPNRLLTQAYQWSMGEHTVELTPDEATYLFALAGFSVERLKGVWLCRESGQLLELAPTASPIGPGSLARRMALATTRLDDSFIWWMEARKTGAPDAEALRDAIVRIFERSWPERVARVRILDGESTVTSDGHPGVLMRRGASGHALIGPYMAVAPGTYEFTLPVSWTDWTGGPEPVCRLEIVADDELFGTAELHAGGATGSARLTCRVTFDTLRFAVHARLWCSGAAEVVAPLTLAMSPEPWAPASSP